MENLLTNIHPDTSLSIRLLNDYCLLHIFGFLPITDQISLSLSSRYFTQLFKQFNKTCNSLVYNETQDNELTPTQIFTSLSYLNPNTQILQIERIKNSSIFDQFISIVYIHCPKISSVTITTPDISVDNFKSLECFPSLHIIRLDFHESNQKICSLFETLQICPSLQQKVESINVAGHYEILGNNFQNFPNLQHLDIQNTSFQPDCFEGFCYNSPQLRSLNILSCKSLDRRNFALMIQLLRNLVTLTITATSNDCPFHLNNFPQLRNLSIEMHSDKNTMTLVLLQLTKRKFELLETLKLNVPSGGMYMFNFHCIRDLENLAELELKGDFYEDETFWLLMGKVKNLKKLVLETETNCLEGKNFIEFLETSNNLAKFQVICGDSPKEDIILRGLEILRKKVATGLRKFLWILKVNDEVRESVLKEALNYKMEDLSTNIHSDTSVSIRLLNDYCLLHIFEFLPITDQISLSFSSSYFSQLFSQFSKTCYSLTYNETQDNELTPTQIFTALNYLNPNIKILQVERIKNSLTFDQFVSTVYIHCPKISSVTITTPDISVDHFKSLECFPSLQSIRLDFHESNRKICSFFETLQIYPSLQQKVESINVAGHYEILGDNFQNFPNLQHLDIQNTSFQPDCFETFCYNSPQLRSLNILSCKSLDRRNFALMIQLLRNLVTLTITATSNDCPFYLTYLPQLRNLSIEKHSDKNAITLVLFQLSKTKFEQLVTLKLHVPSGGMHLFHFQCICDLENLTELELKGDFYKSEVFWISIGKVKKLKFLLLETEINCLEGENFIEFLETSSELAKLRVICGDSPKEDIILRGLEILRKNVAIRLRKFLWAIKVNDEVRERVVKVNNQ